MQSVVAQNVKQQLQLQQLAPRVLLALHVHRVQMKQQHQLQLLKLQQLMLQQK
jgi:hypothetical protein